ncbi:DUF3239 domain-containing protein [Calothrix sp. PCC 6303]|uniref:DUF3239 domain-containing protein n=1 Tax=Calothrix sp. PCC 6303 TaxID=1170562 RepID=UPI0002A050BD|nr:DUF3239 domain-containing protein [Calothrix sp. PCC 6303]AFY99876.1 hypothetical protein Cal6303_0811 [Calothrix sp. PCC 6303]
MREKYQESFTLDDTTYASNPGALQVNYLYWIRSFPQEPIKLIFPLILLAVMIFFINWAFGIGLFRVIRQGKSLDNLPFALLGIIIFDISFWYLISPLLNKLIFLIHRIREHFMYGCVNPGIVVSSKPLLLAVFTDLRKREVRYPAIRILSQPLKWTTKGTIPIGTKFATVALYEESKNPESEHWENFYPIVINCVTGNKRDINRVFRSIPEWEWQALKNGLTQIKDKQESGLYFLEYELNEHD